MKRNGASLCFAVSLLSCAWGDVAVVRGGKNIGICCNLYKNMLYCFIKFGETVLNYEFNIKAQRTGKGSLPF